MIETKWIEERLAGYQAGRRQGPSARLRGDHDLAINEPPRPPLKAAAVLVPLVMHAGAMTVLLTRRTEHLSDHAGQISFPGGRIEPADRDAESAALREADEEIGLDPGRVRVIGRLDTYQTRTGFEVIPVVGLIAPPILARPDPFEVAEVFEVPLAFILDPGNHGRGSRVDRGIERHFYTMPYGDYFIWGATAGMLINLCEVLKDR